MFNSRTTLIIVLTALASQASDLRGQAALDSLVDSRVQIHLARQDRSIEGFGPRQALRGRLLSASSDSLLIQVHPEAAPVAISLHGVYQVEVSRGVSRTRTAVKQAVLGAVTFAGTGAAVDRDVGGNDTESILLWSAGGLILGGLLGAVFPEEGWKRVFRR